MVRKGCILIVLVVFAVGLIIGHLIPYQVAIGKMNILQNTIPTVLVPLFTFIIGLFAGSDILAFFTDLYKERKTKRHTHHDDLIKNVFIPWGKREILFNWYDIQKRDLVQFKEFLQNEFGINETEINEIAPFDSKTVRVHLNEKFISLYIDKYNTKLSVESNWCSTQEFIAREEDDRLNIYEIIHTDEKKEELALEHLKKYDGLVKLRDEMSTTRDKIVNGENAVNEYILTKLEQSASLNFTRGCSSDEDLVIMSIYNAVKDFCHVGGVPDTFTLLPQNNPGVGVTFTFNTSDKALREHREKSRELTELIIKDTNLNKMICKIVEDKIYLAKKTNEFEQCIDGIIYDFTEFNIPLKGTCHICKK